MDYQKIYQNLILKGQTRLDTSGLYIETHHIIPRCMGGTDDQSNLVKLTAQEHYLAHLLLTKIYPNNIKLVYAAFMMTVGNGRNNKLYGWLKEKRFSQPMSEETKLRIKQARALQIIGPRSEATKQKMRGPNPKKGNRGEKNGFYGRHHTPETKKILAEKCARHGRKITEETRLRMKDGFTSERRAKLSAARAERNKNASEEHKQATRQSNINRGIAKQKVKMDEHFDLYTQIFDLLAQDVHVKDIAKITGAAYGVVWTINSKFNYYFEIYMELKNEKQKQG
jgi:hypothetical protein